MYTILIKPMFHYISSLRGRFSNIVSRTLMNLERVINWCKRELNASCFYHLNNTLLLMCAFNCVNLVATRLLLHVCISCVDDACSLSHVTNDLNLSALMFLISGQLHAMASLLSVLHLIPGFTRLALVMWSPMQKRRMDFKAVVFHPQLWRGKGGRHLFPPLELELIRVRCTDHLSH